MNHISDEELGDEMSKSLRQGEIYVNWLIGVLFAALMGCIAIIVIIFKDR